MYIQNYSSTDTGNAEIWSTLVAPNTLEYLDKDEIKRQECIYELITTETTYVHDLEMVSEVFIEPIKERNFMTPQEVATVFVNWEDILIINQRLLSSLIEAQLEGSMVVYNIGDYLYDSVCLYNWLGFS